MPADLRTLDDSDEGSSISANHRGKVFRPFSSLGMDGSNIEGTGIGLTISRHLIERLGGNLDFDSKADESSACWLEQPITSR